MTSRRKTFSDLWLCGEHWVLCGDSTDAGQVSRLLRESKPFLMVTDPPYGIELDSEWRDKAGFNGHGAAEPSYLKHRTKGHCETAISGDTRADWSEAFGLDSEGLPGLLVTFFELVVHAFCDPSLMPLTADPRRQPSRSVAQSRAACSVVSRLRRKT